MRGRTSARGPRGRAVRRTWYTVEHPRRGGAVGRTDLRVRAKSAESGLRKVPRRRSGSGNDGMGLKPSAAAIPDASAQGAAPDEAQEPRRVHGRRGAAGTDETAALASGDFKDNRETPDLAALVRGDEAGRRCALSHRRSGRGGRKAPETRNLAARGPGTGNFQKERALGVSDGGHETPAFAGAGPRIESGAGSRIR